MGKPAVNIDTPSSGHAYLPAFEDSVSIQSAITDVCEMMLHRRIEPKEASVLLYAMQVASTNMAHMNGHKGLPKDKDRDKDKDKKNKKRNGSDSSSSASAPANDSPAPVSPAPKPLPPGTIQARAKQTTGI